MRTSELRACAVVAFALMGVCALSVEVGASPEFLGAERCGACHEAEYKQWRSSGHAVSLARLSNVQQKDAACRGCHTMAPSSQDPELSGVQCESCHGPGSLYAPRYVMRDEKLAELLGLVSVQEDRCAPCHAADTPLARPFKFDEKVVLVQHQPPRAPKAGP